MRLFIKYFLLFLFPILLMGVLGEVLLRRIPNDYRYKREYLDKNSGKIEVLFLGSSHAFYGINPLYTSFESFNAAYVSQSLDYDLAILKKYADKWTHLKYIVLPVDYFSLFSRLEDTEAWRKKNYHIYWGMKTNLQLADYTEMLSSNLEINGKRFYNHYWLKQENITCSKLGWGVGYDSSYSLDLTVSGIKASERHRAKDDRYFNGNVKDLRAIIAFANERGVRVLLYTSPAYKTYTRYLDSAQLAQTTNLVAALAHANDRVFYANLLTDSSFLKSDFYDADHLNGTGARKLTLKIDSLITGSPILHK